MNASRSFIFVLCMVAMGCEHDDGTMPICIRGTVIVQESCTAMALIQIEDGPRMGKAVTVSGVQYDNVVKAPIWVFRSGEVWIVDGGPYTIFFRFRKYQEHRSLVLMTPCPDGSSFYDVPKITITQYALDGCPKPDFWRPMSTQ